MARKSDDAASMVDPDGYLKDSAYAENTTGSFGSGFTPGVKTGGFPASTAPAPNGAGNKTPAIASSPNDTVGAPAVAGGKTLYPQGGRSLSGPAGNAVSLQETPQQAQARILGSTRATSSQGPAQMAAQDDFDRRHGFTPAQRSPDELKAIADLMNPAKPQGNSANSAPAAVLKNSSGDVVGTKSPLDALNNPQSIASEPLPSATTPLLGVPGQLPATGAEAAGLSAGRSVRAAAAAIPKDSVFGSSNVLPVATPEKPIADVPAFLGSGFQANKRVIGNVIGGARGFVSGFSAGAGGRGDAIASGVSNATAAQFQKPTKANPVPVTPTTPTANIDRSKESLGRFGYSDDEFTKRKLAFAGF